MGRYVIPEMWCQREVRDLPWNDSGGREWRGNRRAGI